MFTKLIRFIKSIIYDIDSVFDRDPAARSRLEVLLLYPHIKAIIAYRIANKFYRNEHYFIARWISNRARRKTGIEIHPGATIGSGLFIDHGMGVVIGETAIVGNNVTMFHGATLGGTGNETGKRHPTVGDNVMIGASAKILGNIYIAPGTKVGANAVVVKDTNPNSTVVGIPAREVDKSEKRVSFTEVVDITEYVK